MVTNVSSLVGTANAESLDVRHGIKCPSTQPTETWARGSAKGTGIDSWLSALC